MRKFLFSFCILFFSSAAFAQVIYTEKDLDICNSKFEFAISDSLYEKPINEVFVEIGKTYLGIDYEAFTLEKGEKEQLVIHLTGLDCYTFFESSLVFARCIKNKNTTFEDYQKELINIRYRNGKLEDYTSRLHYASDWLYDNDKRQNVKDITKDIGGILFTNKIDFMSSHSDSYKRLKNNESNITKIANFENEMNNREYYYVPENYINCVEDKIKNGDVILITTNINGLDISHTGIAVKMQNDRIHFMHAPSKGKKVQITEQPLGDYVKSVKKHTGIMVARLIEPTEN